MLYHDSAQMATKSPKRLLIYKKPLPRLAYEFGIKQFSTEIEPTRQAVL